MNLREKMGIPRGSANGLNVNNIVSQNKVTAIDLGLPSGLLWADRNIGANRPEDTGLYYAWGSTEDPADGSDGDFCEDNYGVSPAADINTDLTLENDAAHAKLGGNWRMPTRENFKELYDNCTSEWTTRKGMKGRLFKSKANGRSVFFPAAGSFNGTSLYDRGTYGYYWSASRCGSSYAYYLSFNSGGVNPQYNYDYRYYGFPVRPVLLSSVPK